jgi:hypothetical protein
LISEGETRVFQIYSSAIHITPAVSPARENRVEALFDGSQADDVKTRKAPSSLRQHEVVTDQD